MKKKALRFLSYSIGYSNAVFFALEAYGIRVPKIKYNPVTMVSSM